MWSRAFFQRRTQGFTRRYLGSGVFGDVELLSDARRRYVVKRMKNPTKEAFFREVKALEKIKDIQGVQQLVAVMADCDYSIISLYAGITVRKCLEENLLTQDQLEDVIE